MTEAKWIQKWLNEEFGHKVYYVPNGLDKELMYRTESIEKRKIRKRVERKRVLIEAS